MGIDITAYDCRGPCELGPDPEGGNPLVGFELLSDRPLDLAKFSKSFEVWPLQVDFVQHWGHLPQVGQDTTE